MTLNKHESFLRVGVTGGIGCGKSTVCKLFAELGRPVISADEIAHHLTESDSGIRSAIREKFGETVFLPNGMIDRATLAEIVFNDEEAKEQLNAIVHPAVFEAIEHAISKLKPSERVPYVIIEAALVYESRMDDELQYVIVVTANEETRIQRVMKRDSVTHEAVLARIRSQMDVKEKVELADFVINNNGDEGELVAPTTFIDTLLRAMKPNPKSPEAGRDDE